MSRRGRGNLLAVLFNETFDHTYNKSIETTSSLKDCTTPGSPSIKIAENDANETSSTPSDVPTMAKTPIKTINSPTKDHTSSDDTPSSSRTMNETRDPPSEDTTSDVPISVNKTTFDVPFSKKNISGNLEKDTSSHAPSTETDTTSHAPLSLTTMDHDYGLPRK